MPKILKTKKQSKNYSKTFLFITSVSKGLIALFFTFFIIGALIYKVNDTAFYYFLLYGAVAFGGFLSGFISYKKLGGRGIVIGFITSLILAILVFLIILFSMKFNISGRIFTIFPICILSGIVGGVLSANK